MKYGIFTALIVTLLGLALPAPAADFTAGDITVGSPWSRASAGPAKNGVVYLTIVNNGAAADRLVKAASPAAMMASLHISRMAGDVMKMEPVEAITAEPGKPVELKPGGLHIMLMGLKALLEEGQMFPVTLTFEKAGPVEVKVMVGKAGAMEGHTLKHD